MPIVSPSNDTTRPSSIRITSGIEQQIREIAERDAQTVSAVARRLLMLGLRAETRAANVVDR